jgi:hypothetical protein
MAGWRGRGLRNSCVLRDLDGTALVRIEICERGHEPTEWQLLRARYMAALVAGAEGLAKVAYRHMQVDLKPAELNMTEEDWVTLYTNVVLSCERDDVLRKLRDIMEAKNALEEYEREQKEVVR